MSLFRCPKCNWDCQRRKTSFSKNGIKHLAYINTHKDGSKERLVWAKIDIETDQPLAVNFMGSLQN